MSGSPFEPVCVLASAGCGKTYALSSRYLALLFAGVEPGAILATTFTRAAAGEIRDRVLLRLADAVDDASARDELTRTTGIGPIDEAAARAVLRRVADSMHRLEIRTLDSFFFRIVAAFGIELGLGFGPDGRVPTLLDEAGEMTMRRAAIERTLRDTTPEETVAMLQSLGEGRAGRPVIDAIDREVSSFHTLWRETPSGAWEAIAARPEHPHVGDAIDRLVAAQVVGKQATKAHAKAIDAARRGDWMTFLGGGFGAKVVAGETTFARSTIEPGVVDAYRPLIEHGKAVLINQLRRRSIATREFLARYDASLEIVKHRAGVMSFGDLPLRLRQTRQYGGFDEIGYRMDGAVVHLLLDEFQDTSFIQWESLRALVEDVVVEQDRSFFCVGDVKQSIYGWRDACPEILESVPNLLRAPGGPPVVRTERRDESRRSSPVVIEFVNRLFSDVAKSPAMSKRTAAAAAWDRAFVPHTAHHVDRSGFVEVRSVEVGDDKEDRVSRRVQAAADRVEAIRATRPDVTIGVLTRSNAFARRVLHELGPAGRGVPVTGAGGAPLTDTAPVLAILDALTLAEHPGASAAAFHVAQSPLGPVIGLHDGRDTHARSSVARAVRLALARRGFASLIQEWVDAIAPDVTTVERGRLRQLVAVADRFEERPWRRIDEFTRHVEALEVRVPGDAPVQVMTVHRAKGLEFDAVVLPELDMELARTPVAAFARLDSSDGPGAKLGPIEAASHWASGPLRELLDDDERAIFEQHLDRVARESLCGLYVGVTRARNGLFIILDESGGDATAAGVVNAALDAPAAAPDDGTGERVWQSWGDPDWEVVTTVPADRSETAPQHTRSPRTVVPRGTVQRGRRAAAPSADQRSTPLLRQRLTLDTGDDRVIGTVVHRLFEQIDWLDAFVFDRPGLRSVARSAAPTAERAVIDAAIDLFEAALARPGVRDVLTPPSAGTLWSDAGEVHREWRFARVVDGALQQGTVDRLVLHRGEAGATSAEVIDFKTEVVPAGTATAAAERHGAQLATYAEAVAERFGLSAESVRASVLFVRTGDQVAIG